MQITYMCNNNNNNNNNNNKLLNLRIPKKNHYFHLFSYNYNNGDLVTKNLVKRDFTVLVYMYMWVYVCGSVYVCVCVCVRTLYQVHELCWNKIPEKIIKKCVTLMI